MKKESFKKRKRKYVVTSKTYHQTKYYSICSI